MSNFKPGDKVKCVAEAPGLPGRLGETYYVKYVSEDTGALFLDLYDTLSILASPDRFEPVPKEETSIEALVRKANEGVKALIEIRDKYSDKVIYDAYPPLPALDFDFVVKKNPIINVLAKSDGLFRVKEGG